MTRTDTDHRRGQSNERSRPCDHGSVIALQPGVAIWQRYFDPKKDGGVRLEGESVVEYPQLKEFQPVTVKAARLRTDEHTGQVVIKGGELLP